MLSHIDIMDFAAMWDSPLATTQQPQSQPLTSKQHQQLIQETAQWLATTGLDSQQRNELLRQLEASLISLTNHSTDLHTKH